MFHLAGQNENVQSVDRGRKDAICWIQDVVPGEVDFGVIHDSKARAAIFISDSVKSDDIASGGWTILGIGLTLRKLIDTNSSVGGG